jgi:hypothetical protein
MFMVPIATIIMIICTHNLILVKKLVEMIPVPVEVVKNIKNAVDQTRVKRSLSSN